MGMQNGIQQIKNKREQQFARWLESRNRPYIYHPCYIRLGLDKYQPDFLLTDTGEYIEVVGSRQAFHTNRWKIEKAQQAGFKILLFKPNGSAHIQHKKRLVGLPFEYRRQDVNRRKRFIPAPEGTLRLLRQKLNLRQYEAAHLLGIRVSYLCLCEHADEGLLKFKTSYLYRVKFTKKEKFKEKVLLIKKRLLAMIDRPEWLPQIIENGRCIELTR